MEQNGHMTQGFEKQVEGGKKRKRERFEKGESCDFVWPIVSNLCSLLSLSVLNKGVSFYELMIPGVIQSCLNRYIYMSKKFQTKCKTCFGGPRMVLYSC